MKMPMDVNSINYIGMPSAPDFTTHFPPYYKEVQIILVFVMLIGFMYCFYLSRKYPYVEVFEEYENASRWNLPEVEL